MIVRLKVSGPYENLIVSRTICDQRELYRKHSKAVRGQVLLPPAQSVLHKLPLSALPPCFG